MSLTLSSVPDWLSNNSLQKIFEKKLNKKCTVLSVDFDKGSTAGDHYLSEIIRLKVKIREDDKEETFPLIIKNECAGFSDFLEEMNGVAKEMEMYAELVPFANNLLKKPVCADCYFLSSDNCLILEDLSCQGYGLVERRQQLDFDHCLIALRTLAQFHAVCARFLEISPNSLKVSKEETEYTLRKDNIMYNLEVHVIKTAIDSIKRRPHGKEFVKNLEAYLETFWTECHEAVLGDYDFKTINHGDYWLSNTLFKYENGKVVHCKIVDYQLTKYTTPCFDIHVFISTSIQQEVRDESMDLLLDEYLLTLNETLKDIGSSQSLSRASLNEALDRTKVIGILYGLCLSPVVLRDPKHPLKFEGLTKEEICTGFKNNDPYKNVCEDEKIYNHIISLLKFHRRKNYI